MIKIDSTIIIRNVGTLIIVLLISILISAPKQIIVVMKIQVVSVSIIASSIGLTFLKYWINLKLVQFIKGKVLRNRLNPTFRSSSLKRKRKVSSSRLKTLFSKSKPTLTKRRTKATALNLLNSIYRTNQSLIF